ncbi:hypothetical protein GCM10017786_36700 [Amycolatopsis deserti]|uniref:Secreted protein n=1 Tax=Amycolatopsis deserti TaxID=185696 RepID=A0ABQ3J0U1_9PSEU|nr:lysyl oxidase family protein [Amycolatopsis deserti]GHF00511.1 hypothetical protein GCM10017786_36700 [Amycolatopsis deserti]
MLRRIGPLAMAAVLLILAPGVAGAAEELRPDLGMAPLTDVKVTTGPSGQRQLRFSATIVNVGRGPFEVEAARASVDAPFRVVQRVPRADGSRADVGVPAGLVYGGDGHDHWHIRDLETYQLVRLDGGVVSVSAKAGFCFYDTNSYRRSLQGAPRSKVYPASGCGKRDWLSVSMGLSVGWADRYAWTLPDQFVDITGLPDGHYRLLATADAQGLFVESDRTNNATWVDVALTSRKGRTSVQVLGRGPAA